MSFRWFMKNLALSLCMVCVCSDLSFAARPRKRVRPDECAALLAQMTTHAQFPLKLHIQKKLSDFLLKRSAGGKAHPKVSAEEVHKNLSALWGLALAYFYTGLEHHSKIQLPASSSDPLPLNHLFAWTGHKPSKTIHVKFSMWSSLHPHDAPPKTGPFSEARVVDDSQIQIHIYFDLIYNKVVELKGEASRSSDDLTTLLTIALLFREIAVQFFGLFETTMHLNSGAEVIELVTQNHAKVLSLQNTAEVWALQAFLKCFDAKSSEFGKRDIQETHRLIRQDLDSSPERPLAIAQPFIESVMPRVVAHDVSSAMRTFNEELAREEILRLERAFQVDHEAFAAIEAGADPLSEGIILPGLHRTSVFPPIHRPWFLWNLEAWTSSSQDTPFFAALTAKHSQAPIHLHFTYSSDPLFEELGLSTDHQFIMSLQESRGAPIHKYILLDRIWGFETGLESPSPESRFLNLEIAIFLALTTGFSESQKIPLKDLQPQLSPTSLHIYLRALAAKGILVDPAKLAENLGAQMQEMEETDALMFYLIRYLEWQILELQPKLFQSQLILPMGFYPQNLSIEGLRFRMADLIADLVEDFIAIKHLKGPDHKPSINTKRLFRIDEPAQAPGITGPALLSPPTSGSDFLKAAHSR